MKGVLNMDYPGIRLPDHSAKITIEDYAGRTFILDCFDFELCVELVSPSRDHEVDLGGGRKAYKEPGENAVGLKAKGVLREFRTTS